MRCSVVKKTSEGRGEENRGVERRGEEKRGVKSREEKRRGEKVSQLPVIKWKSQNQLTTLSTPRSTMGSKYGIRVPWK